MVLPSREEAAGRRAAAAGGLRSHGRDGDAGDARRPGGCCWRRAGPGTPGLKVLCGGEALPRELAERLLARGARALEHVRPDRDDGLVDAAARRRRRRAGADRPADREHAASTCSTRSCSRCRWACRASCTSAATGLARGYLERPDADGRALRARPVRREPGARLYRTGDLARWLAGRRRWSSWAALDHQVKVRGFRIELGEIEAALRRHPAVREAVVVAREDAPGDKRLVAYVVARRRRRPDAASCARTCAERCRSTWCPSAFVVLDALPLTPNGKVDRKALPAPELGRASGAGVRGAAHAGRGGAGGDLGARCWAWSGWACTTTSSSWAATRCWPRRWCRACATRFGVELPLRALFEAPTRGGAGGGASRRRAGAARCRRCRRSCRCRATGALPLSFAQERLWFLDQLEPGSAALQHPRGACG